MCGRFNVIDNPELQKLLQDLGIDLGLPSRTNIAPTEMIAAVRSPAPLLDARLGIEPAAPGTDPELVQLRWWLTPSWAKAVDQKYSMFNARSETVASSRAFREPFKRRRCIVPMSSFIEWRSEEGGRQPYLISAVDGALAVAGIWEHWQGQAEDCGGDAQVIESCALLTTAAAQQFSHIHKRMPVILRAGDWNRWLDCGQAIDASDPILAPELKSDLQVVPIHRGINNARHKDANLLEPMGKVQMLSA
jgi:putative SOS response-associated peptidase YedK